MYGKIQTAVLYSFLQLCKSFSVNHFCYARHAIVCAVGKELPLDYFEKRVDGEVKYKGVIVNVRLDRAELVNGALVRREVVEHPGGVTILPIDDEGNCWLVRQFRYPFQKSILEAPAGKLEPGEAHRLSAERELSEETGFTADTFLYLGPSFVSPGISTEVLHIYLALGLHAGESHPDENEFLNAEKFKLDDVVDMVMRGEIEDGKTIVAVLKADKLRREHKI